MANETQKVVLARIDERTKVLPGIEKHLRDLNNSISDTNVKLAKTDQIAQNADKKADSNHAYTTKWAIGLFLAYIAGLCVVLAQAL